MRSSLVYLYLLLLMGCFPVSAWPDQLIVEPEMGRKPIIDAINQAEHSIKIVMYGFTDQTLLTSLVKQKAKGKTIKIILERYPYRAETENNKIILALNKNGIPWQGKMAAIQLIHQKTLIIDAKRAVIMTFNFTQSSFKNERNFALIVDNPQQVKEIETVFDSDWHHTSNQNYASNMLWSPENSREQLIKIIQRAKKSIDIYAQHLSDFKIVGALAKAARKGVSIKILTSKKIRAKQANYLSRAGVIVRQSQGYYIHAKAFIIDNKLAIIGSINLTRASFDYNRELAISTTDAVVVKQMHETFERDWRNAQASKASKPYLDRKTVLHGLRIMKHVIGF